MARDLTYTTAEVLANDLVSPHLRRLVLGGPGLASWTSCGSPDEAVLLVVPDPTTGLVDLDGPRAGTDYDRTRWYTVRSHDAAAGTISVEVVRHEIGCATTWADRARPGSAVGVSSPTCWFSRPEDAAWQLLVGDLAALPAISRAVEETPAGVRTTVRVLVDDLADARDLSASPDVEVEWVRAVGGTDLGSLTRSAHLPAGPGYVFVAGEAAATRDARRYVRHELGRGADGYCVVGYWRTRSAEWDAQVAAAQVDLAGIYERAEAEGLDEEQLADEVDRALVDAGL